MAHQCGHGGMSNEILSDTAKNPLPSARVTVSARHDEPCPKALCRTQETHADVLALIGNVFESSYHSMST